MPDEPNQPSSPSSPAGGNPPAAAAASPPASGSPANPNPAPASSAPVARPTYVPESHWDKTGGKIKDEAAFASFINDHVAFKAADDSRRLSLPQKAEDLPAKLPADFVVPQGIEFALNEQDPLIGKGREFALKHGLSKEGWGELLALYAGGQVSSAGALKTQREAEIGKLGATGTARVTAVQTWLGAQIGEDAAKHMATMLVTAGHVEGFEKLIRNFTNQGAGNFDQRHRETPQGNGKIEGYEKMTFEQKRHAQDQLAAAR